MRILMITGIFPPDIGGPATYVPRLADALSRQGHAVTVVTLSERVDSADDAYPFHVVRLARQQRQPWRWLRTISRLVHLGRDAEVLFVNGLALEVTLANLFLRKPLVLKVVGDLAWEQATNRGWIQDTFEDFQRNRYSMKVAMLRRLRTWWTRSAHQVIVPSRYLADWVATWGIPAEKIRVIYNAIDLPAQFSSCHIPLATPVKIATVGRLVVWKQMDKLITAMGRWEGVGLVVVGDGPERERLTALTRELQLSQRVYFAGQKSSADTLALLNACNLFVLNSRYEGLPHVVLEALALGLPIVATAVGGVPEVVENGRNGHLLDPADPYALDETLARLLARPEEWRRLAAGARQTAPRFGFGRMVEDTATVLAAASARPAPSGGKVHVIARGTFS